MVARRIVDGDGEIDARQPGCDAHLYVHAEWDDGRGAMLAIRIERRRHGEGPVDFEPLHARRMAQPPPGERSERRAAVIGHRIEVVRVPTISLVLDPQQTS